MPWWAQVIERLVFVALLLAFLAWLDRRRRRQQRKPTGGEMYHPRSTLFAGIITSILLGALFATYVLFEGIADPWVPALLLTLSLAGVFAVLHYFRARHRLSGEGLWYGRTFASPRFVRWADVTSVRYSFLGQWFRLESDEAVIRVSALALGLPEFAQSVLEAVPASSIEERAQVVLEAAAGSRLNDYF